jgi:hypothetical protein
MKMRITAWLNAIQKSFGLREDGDKTPSEGERTAVADQPTQAVRPTTAARDVARATIAVSRRVKEPEEYVCLGAGDLFEDVMRIPPPFLRTVFSTEALRGLLIGLTGVVEELRRVRPGGDAAGALVVLARRCGEAHAVGVLRIATAAVRIEQTMRWLAWALDARQPWTLRPHIAASSDPTRALHHMQASSDEPVVVVWASPSPVPVSFAEQARLGEVALLVPEAVPSDAPAWTVIGGAEIEALGIEAGSKRTIWLSATAAFVQAILRGHRTGWVSVRLPVGAVQLEVVNGLREARRVREQRCVGMLRFAQGSDEFVVPPLFAPRERATSGQTWVVNHVAR